MRAIRHIVIHCSATPNGDGRFTLEDLDRMHRERGWRKIGYHYVIETTGELRQGRDETEIGAHVEGSNANSIGICMIGTNAFFSEQWRTLAFLVRELQRRYPSADVKGHRDYSPDKDGDGVIEPWEWMKTCPGFDVSAWLTGAMSPGSENLLLPP